MRREDGRVRGREEAEEERKYRKGRLDLAGRTPHLQTTPTASENNDTFKTYGHIP